MFTSISKRNPSGFTIIELLVVVSIITILITLLLPSLASSRTLTRLLMCSNNLRGIALASAGYSTDNGQWTVHGAEAYYYAPSGYGYRFYNTQIFDDDWGDGKPGTPGSYNLSTNGAQNICGVGQLMWDYHLAERPELILCPQTDYREPTIFTPAGSASNYTFKMMKDKMNQYFTTNFDPVTPTGN